MKPLVLTSIGRALPALDALTATDGVEVKRVPLLPAASALDAERPTVVLLDRALAQSTGEERALFAQLAEQAALVGLGERGETEPPDALPGALLAAFIAADAPAAAARVALHGALRHAAALVAAR
ncbi:MAG TPA: hypothetical protein VIH11_05485, partial [Gemmatimonadaceae bacterium]